MPVFNRPYNQEIRITDVCRFAASLGTRFIRTQVTPRVLRLVVIWSGRCPKCCGVRQRFRTLNVIHTKWRHIRTCDGLSEQATQKVKKVIRLRPLLNEGGHNIPVKQYINYLPERLLSVDSRLQRLVILTSGLKSQRNISKVKLRPRHNRNFCRNVCFQGLTDVPSTDATSQASVALAWVTRRRQPQTRYDFGL